MKYIAEIDIMPHKELLANVIMETFEFELKEDH